ncbi:DUF4132 domain-containing protein [uncultured Corynebacterium sp.]|uniref:DUF4132 domain-containing protein n=1 Tax=uncultured Corynebacterium sp. TaxID=159447 RepID=UPI0025FC5970|nr:DUF4132 domain-containing protein [uncultured Corynebacterium sp.]
MTETWVTAGDYRLALTDDGIVAQNAKGKQLKTVPSKAKKTPEYDQLEALETFYGQHDRLCLDTVRGWFLTAAPVAALLIASVWEDAAWRSCLENLLVSGSEGTGLLKGVEGESVLLIDLDGESVTVTGDLVILHPALVEDLDDWREFAVDLGVVQRIDQLLRTVHRMPEDAASRTAELRRFADGKYGRGAHLIGRARGAGYTATLDSIRVTTVNGGVTTVGEMSVDAWDPAEEATLGELSFWRDGDQLDPTATGTDATTIDPVAWSETIRMGEYLYSGRTIEDSGENQS